MTTLVQTAPNGVVIEGGWYPVVAWAVRSTDNAVIGRVADWRGGAGNRPPIGWIRDDGTLTDDPDEAWAFPGQAVDVAGARGSLRGALSASMAVAAGSAQGETAADWTDVATGFSADNGLPGDVRAKLRIPNTRLAGQLGWLIEAERDGETRAIVLAWGEYTGSAGTALPTAVGEALTIRYRANFEDDSGDWFEVAVRVGPLVESVTVRLYPALNGAGQATDAQLAALRADVANVERELAQVHDLPNTGGVTLSELLLRLASYETVSDAAGTHRALRQRVKSVSAANGQLHVVTVDADGAETTTAVTLGDGAGATQAHTDNQITALAGALISTLPEFGFDAGTRRLTFRPDPPAAGSITEVMLARTLANTLAGKLNAADVLDAAKRSVRTLSAAAAASFRARIGLDDDAPNALPYAGVPRGSWDYDTTTGGAGVLADSGIDVAPADLSIAVGDVTIAVAQLPANAAGYNGNTDASRVHSAQIDGTDWFFALDGLRLLAAPDEARRDTLAVTAAGYRLEDPGDRNKPTARWPKVRLPEDAIYAATQRFTLALLAKLEALGTGEIELSSVTVTPVEDVDEVVVDRRPGQRAMGVFSGDTGDAARRVEGAYAGSDGMTVYLRGSAEDVDIQFGARRRLLFADARDLGEDEPGIREYEWSDGDFSAWLIAGQPVEVTLREKSAPIQRPDADDKLVMTTALGGFRFLDPVYSVIQGPKPPVDAEANVPAPFPAQQDYDTSGGKTGRVQILQRDVETRLDRRTTFVEYDVAGQDDRWAAQTNEGRWTFYPGSDLSGNRNRFHFAPRPGFDRTFAPVAVSVATAADGTDREELALADDGHGGFLSAVASPNNRVSPANPDRWLNLSNAANTAQGQWYYLNETTTRYTASELAAAFPLALLNANRPKLETRARPQAGWDFSSGYVLPGGVALPPSMAGLDDNRFVRIGATAAGGFAIPQSINGGRAWSPWVRGQHLKTLARLAAPYAAGGENALPRFSGDAETNFGQAVNAVLCEARDVFKLYCRVDDLGHLRFWSDQPARLGSILTEATNYPIG